jgi:hypothetical protein
VGVGRKESRSEGVVKQGRYTPHFQNCTTEVLEISFFSSRQVPKNLDLELLKSCQPIYLNHCDSTSTCRYDSPAWRKGCKFSLLRCGPTR